MITGNAPETCNYKFDHLTCILWPHYLEKCKKSLWQCYPYICFQMIRLLLTTTATMQLSGRPLLTASVQRDIPLREHNKVCYATVQLPRPSCCAGIQSTSQPAAAPSPQLDHIPGYMLLHHTPDGIIHNLGQDCRMATFTIDELS